MDDHRLELMEHMIDYLIQIWESEGSEQLEKSFRNLGFTTKDLEEYNIDFTINWMKAQED